MADAEEIAIRRSGDVAVVQAPSYISEESGQQNSSAVASLQHDGVTGVVINMSTADTRRPGPGVPRCAPVSPPTSPAARPAIPSVRS